MIRRSKKREIALQLLYERDLHPEVSRQLDEDFVAERLGSESHRAGCLALLDGVLAHVEDIDRRLSAASDNWRLTRMTAVDRNVLRLGAYELLFGLEPPAVVINEAVELARRFGGKNSPAFVNGVLDRVYKSNTAAT